MELEKYLRQRHTEGTTKRYYNDILKYLETVTKDKALTATYSDIMNYIGELRKKYSNPETIKCTLQGIKKYYYWLGHTGQRKDHPCRNLNLKDKTSRDVQLQDLFTTEELELLMDRKERYRNLRTKNQVIISLLIYQGLTTGDITNLTLNDIDLEEGTIYVKATPKLNRRTLKLNPRQIMLFYKYINEERPKLQAKQKQPEELQNFILTHLGTPETGYSFKNLFQPFKKQFPGRTLHAKTIRQSVIANLLKQGNDLRIVQAFAGHKYPGSTEAYRQTGIEELKAGIQKYHPLNQD
jgi:site-specific recombinase XerD